MLEQAPVPRVRYERMTVSERLVKAVSHPIRLKAFTILGERPASPKEIAAEIGEELGHVAYHVRELDKLGFIELVKTAPRRGATEHFYRGTSLPVLDDQQWAALTEAERDAYSAVGMQLILADASLALAERTFDRRGDRHMTRSPMQVDEEGWTELTKLLAETFHRLDEIKAASIERVAETAVETFPVTTVLLGYERPRRIANGVNRHSGISHSRKPDR